MIFDFNCPGVSFSVRLSQIGMVSAMSSGQFYIVVQGVELVHENYHAHDVRKFDSEHKRLREAWRDWFDRNPG